MLDLLSYLPILIFATSLVTVAVSLRQAVLALRAKRRIKGILSAHAEAKEILLAATHEGVDRAAGTVAARAAIERAMRELSPQDQKLLRRGLTQPSRIGEERFVRELVS